MSSDLSENYARAYGTRVGFGARPALILIDFCQGYFDPVCDLYAGVEAALASALRVRSAAREAGVPVILTNVVYHPTAIDGGRFYEKAAPLRHFVAGNSMGGWPEGLVPAADELERFPADVNRWGFPPARFSDSRSLPMKEVGMDGSRPFTGSS